MEKITTINDLKNLVDDWSGSEGLARERISHSDNVEIVARQIAAERPDGLSWGDDWSQYLADIRPVWEYLD